MKNIFKFRHFFESKDEESKDEPKIEPQPKDDPQPEDNIVFDMDDPIYGYKTKKIIPPKKVKRKDLENHPLFKYISKDVFKKMVRSEGEDSQEEISEDDIVYTIEDLPIQMGDIVKCKNFDDLNDNQLEFLHEKPFHKVKGVVDSRGRFYTNGEPHIELGYKIPFKMKRFTKVDTNKEYKYKVLFLQFDLPIDLHGEKDKNNYFKGKTKFSELFETIFKEKLSDCYVDFSQYEDIYQVGKEFYIYDHKLKEFDFVFFGFMANFTTLVKMLINYLDRHKVPYLKYGTYKDFDNKAYEMHLIQELGYPYIPSIMTTKLTTKVIQNIKEFGFPVIVKDINLNRGEGVWKCEDMKDLAKYFGGYMSSIKLIQKFIPNDGDFRVISIKNRVELVIKKERIPGTTEFRANVARGGRAIKGTLPLEIIDMCQDISRHLVCDIVGFDIIQDKETGEYYVMETNSSPHFPTFSVISEIDIPGIIVDYIIRKIKK